MALGNSRAVRANLGIPADAGEPEWLRWLEGFGSAAELLSEADSRNVGVLDLLEWSLESAAGEFLSKLGQAIEEESACCFTSRGDNAWEVVCMMALQNGELDAENGALRTALKEGARSKSKTGHLMVREAFAKMLADWAQGGAQQGNGLPEVLAELMQTPVDWESDFSEKGRFAGMCGGQGAQIFSMAKASWEKVLLARAAAEGSACKKLGL